MFLVMPKRIWFALLLIALLFGFYFYSERASGQDESLPKAEAILDKYVQAAGGQEAFDKIKNRYTEGVLDLGQQGIKLRIKAWSAKPNLIYTEMESDMLGKTERGCDGEVLWENSAMSGPVIHEGKDRHDGMLLIRFDRMVYWKEVYGKAECTGVEEVGGKPCYKVVLHPLPFQAAAEGDAAEEPKPHVAYFDKESGLLARLDLTMENPMGAVSMENYLQDYRKVDGILFPFKVVMKIMGMERSMTIEKVEQNVDMPADRFALPAEIKELMASKAADAAAGEEKTE